MKKNLTKKMYVAGTALVLLAISAGGACLNGWSTFSIRNTNTTTNNNTTNNTPAYAKTNTAAAQAANSTILNSNRASAATPANTYALNSSSKVITMESQKTFEAAAPAPKAQPVAAAPAVKQTTGRMAYTNFAPAEYNYRRYRGNVRFAPEVGANLNGMYHNSTSNSMINGFHAGVMADVTLTDHISLQPGLQYITKGNQTTCTFMNQTNDGNQCQKTTLGYVEMPVNVVYKFGRPDQGRFMIGAGGYVAYLTNAETKNTTNVQAQYEGAVPVSETSNTTPNGTSNLRKLDYGVGAFIGCEMPRGMYFKAGTELGLRDTQKGIGNKNYGFNVSLGFLIP